MLLLSRCRDSFRLNERRERQVRIALDEPHQRPHRVHRRVPVETAVEGELPLVVVGRTIRGLPQVSARGRSRVRSIETGQRHGREPERLRLVEDRGLGRGSDCSMESRLPVAAGGAVVFVVCWPCTTVARTSADPMSSVLTSCLPGAARGRRRRRCPATPRRARLDRSCLERPWPRGLPPAA